MSLKLGKGMFSKAFEEIGIFEFGEACEWVRALPYRRNSLRGDPLRVMKESCGTCSSKHELIKRLADENDVIDCHLVLCIFKMNGVNTPKVGHVLDQYGLNYIPEAHSYLMLNGAILDLTFPDNPDLLYQKHIFYTENISADQIRTYKSETHKGYLNRWIKKEEIPYTFQEVWALREACIVALS